MPLNVLLYCSLLLHNVCLAWVFFQQYVITGQVEPDLVAAAFTVLVDVAADTKQGSRDPLYAKVLLSALGGMQEWSEKRLLDYHDSYEKGIGGAATEGMEILLSLALAAGKIIADRECAGDGNFAGDRVDYYVRCSMKSAFTNVIKLMLLYHGTLVQSIDLFMTIFRFHLVADT